MRDTLAGDKVVNEDRRKRQIKKEGHFSYCLAGPGLSARHDVEHGVDDGQCMLLDRCREQHLLMSKEAHQHHHRREWEERIEAMAHASACRSPLARCSSSQAQRASNHSAAGVLE